jgi:DNA-binding response OmpR family regulator
VGPYVFFPAHRRLEMSDGASDETHVIHLREKETDLLLFLVTAPDGYASRQSLLSHVWGVQTDLETRTLESHIHQLRQKLDATDTGLKLIHNVGDGYHLKS